MEGKRTYINFLIDIVKMLITRGGLLVISLVYSVYVTRNLNVQDKGNYELLVTIYTMGVQICNLGLHSSFTYYLAKDYKVFSKIWGNALLVTVVTFFLELIALFLGYMILGITYNAGVFWVVFMIPLQLYYLFQYQMFIAVNNVNMCNAIEIAKSMLPLLILPCISIRGSVNSSSILIINILVMAAINGISNTYMRKKYAIVPSVDKHLLKKSIALGLRAYLTCLLSFLILRVDIIMVKALLGERQLGIYSLAVNIIDMLYIIPSVIGALLFPKLCTISNYEKQRKFAKKILILTSIGMLVIEGIAFIVSPIVIPFVYGKAYADSVTAFRYLLVGAFFWGTASILNNYWAAKEKYIYSIVGNICALVTNLGMNSILIPKMGIEGAVWGSNISYIILYLVLFIAFIVEKEK